MKLGIMQPYFFPYLGYWQLLNAVDQYVIYDNIQFTKNSWIRRNRILSDGTDKMFTLPLKKDSDYLDVCQRSLSDDFDKERIKLLRLIESSYKNAPMFGEVFPFIKDIFDYDSRNLFQYIYNSVKKICGYLGINTIITVSSTLDIDFSLKGKDKVLSICKYMKATDYYNAINGVPLYDPYRIEFESAGITLHFLRMKDVVYPQFKNDFIPNLSIIDVLMFNSKETIQNMLNQYELL